MVITTAGEGGITTVGGMAAIMAGGIEDGSSTRSDGLRAPLKPLNLNVPAASYRQTGAGRSAHLTLTFGTVRSTYRAPAAGPLVADIRRGFEIPRTKEPACRLILRERAGQKRAVRIPGNLNRLTTDAD